MTDLEPASALAERIAAECFYVEPPSFEESECAKLIEADRVAVREAALMEAIAVVGVLDAEYFEHNRVAGELALRRAGSEIAKLLTGKRTHG